MNAPRSAAGEGPSYSSTSRLSASVTETVRVGAVGGEATVHGIVVILHLVTMHLSPTQIVVALDIEFEHAQTTACRER